MYCGWKYEDATEIWINIWKHFGDSFFLEYQANNTEPQKELNKRIYEISKTFGIQTIIGLDTHYINDEDCAKRDNLLLRKNSSMKEKMGGLWIFQREIQYIKEWLNRGVFQKMK